MMRTGKDTFLDGLVSVYLDSALHPVVVVGAGDVLEAAANLLGVQAIAGDPTAPMIDSLCRAIDVLPGDVVGAVVQPVDAPYTTADMITLLTSGPPDRPRVLATLSSGEG